MQYNCITSNILYTLKYIIYILQIKHGSFKSFFISFSLPAPNFSYTLESEEETKKIHSTSLKLYANVMYFSAHACARSFGNLLISRQTTQTAKNSGRFSC